LEIIIGALRQRRRIIVDSLVERVRAESRLTRRLNSADPLSPFSQRIGVR
jgi:hypothetical protein